MKKARRIIFHFCFIFRVFCFQAKEILTVWSSTLHVILPVGYTAPQKLIHAEWPAVLKCLWENKMVWLQLRSHKIMKKKKKENWNTECARAGPFPTGFWGLGFACWDDSWLCQGQQHHFSEVFQGLHILGARAKLSGTTWCLKCSCKATESLVLPRGWHQS